MIEEHLRLLKLRRMIVDRAIEALRSRNQQEVERCLAEIRREVTQRDRAAIMDQVKGRREVTFNEACNAVVAGFRRSRS